MDFGAYAQIEQLEQLLTANHIEISRIRGLRLMSEEEPLSEEVIKGNSITNWAGWQNLSLPTSW